MTEAKAQGLSAIERATRHFKALPSVRIEVAQWADDEGRPLVITAERFNLHQQDQLDRMKRTYKGFELMAHVLIRWAKDEQGAPLFTVEDKHHLTHGVDPEILAEVAYKITNPPDPEAIKKN